MVDASAGDAVEQVIELTGGGVEWSSEGVGSAATAEQAFGMLRVGGTCTVVGVLAGSTVSLDGITLNWDRRIQGSLMGSIASGSTSPATSTCCRAACGSTTSSRSSSRWTSCRLDRVRYDGDATRTVVTF